MGLKSSFNSQNQFITPYSMIDFEFQDKTPQPNTYQVQLRKFHTRQQPIIFTQQQPPKLLLRPFKRPQQSYINQLSPFKIDFNSMLQSWNKLLAETKTHPKKITEIYNFLVDIFNGFPILRLASLTLQRQFSDLWEAKNELQNNWIQLDYNQFVKNLYIFLEDKDVYIGFIGNQRIILSCFELVLFDYSWDGQHWRKS